MKKLFSITIVLLISVLTGCDSNDKIIEDGCYKDNMGSGLIISHNEDNQYLIDFGVYKVTRFETAVGEYDTATGILHFTANNYDGKSISANIINKDEYLLVTITDWEFECFLPNGTELDFYKQ